MKIALYVTRYKGEMEQTPPSLQYIASYLIKEGLTTEDNIIFADSADEIIKFNPQILGIGSVSQTVNDAIKVATKVKEALPECLNILGGYHITALFDTLPSVFDIGVIGEGEVTFAEIVAINKNLGLINEENLEKIKGICFRNKEGKVILTEKRPQIKNIDDLPLPLIRLPQGFKWAYIFSARGCPYKCKYCASNAFWGNYRFHSAEYIVNLIEKLYYDFGITKIYSVDDLFIAPKERLHKIKQLLQEKNLLGKLSFKGFIRINMFDEEICILLKELGFIEARFGLETASERLLSALKDKPFTIKQVENTINLCKKYDLPLCASLMFGIPGETEEDIEITKNFMLKHKDNLYSAGIYLLQPVPGTILWNECVKKGLVSANMDFSKFDPEIEAPHFSWDNVLYYNEHNISFVKFKKIMQNFIHKIHFPNVFIRYLYHFKCLFIKRPLIEFKIFQLFFRIFNFSKFYRHN